MVLFGLSDETIDSINAILGKHQSVTKAVVYGSRAMGSYRPASDIDLVLFGEDVSLTEFFAIENELDDLLLPYKIDLSLHQHLNNPDLVAHIEREGKLFYSRT